MGTTPSWSAGAFGATPVPSSRSWRATSGIHSLYNHFVLPPVLATAILVAVAPGAARRRLRPQREGDVGVAHRRLRHRHRDPEPDALRPDGRHPLRGLSAVAADALSRNGGGGHALPPARPARAVDTRQGDADGARGGPALAFPGDEVKANLEELRYPERSIGPTGMLAPKPLQTTSTGDLWQFSRREEARGAVRSRA